MRATDYVIVNVVCNIAIGVMISDLMIVYCVQFCTARNHHCCSNVAVIVIYLYK